MKKSRIGIVRLVFLERCGAKPQEEFLKQRKGWLNVISGPCKRWCKISPPLRFFMFINRWHNCFEDQLFGTWIVTNHHESRYYNLKSDSGACWLEWYLLKKSLAVQLLQYYIFQYYSRQNVTAQNLSRIKYHEMDPSNFMANERVL